MIFLTVTVRNPEGRLNTPRHLLMLPAMAQRLSRTEYHQWAADQPKGRFERVAGTPVAMAPERWVHARLYGD